MDPRTGNELPAYAYETDESPKKKHRWGRSWPGFVRLGGQVIGKCPDDLSTDEAERMLNAGVPYFNPRGGDHPAAIYSVGRGAVYRAVPTRPGLSYHGFPALPKEVRGLPKRLREQILDLARTRGEEAQVRKWIDEDPEIEER